MKVAPGPESEKHNASASARRRLVSSGTAMVLGLGLVFGVGWFLYRPYIPPGWLRDFGADIALRAAADPDPPPPTDTRQVTPRGLADSPYICVAKVVHEPWDRLVVVAAGQEVRAHPILSGARWPSAGLENLAAQMARDDRYQLLVLLKDNAVLDAQLFYTFWGILEGIARPEGYTREEAIFTAASKGGIYVVTQAADVPADACR
ncbi:MAG: hypothetical protein EXQ84_07820 [Rhodospirillaceae bacterium]|nr:hypothetical protein [Rhodospirillaceae bacterium]